MAKEKLVYIGLKGKVLALSRSTGEMKWTASLNSGLFSAGFVHVLVDGDCVFASSQGEITCIDAVSGAVRWRNPLRGYGVGLASIATETSSSPANLTAQELAQQQAAAAHASSGAVR